MRDKTVSGSTVAASSARRNGHPVGFIAIVGLAFIALFLIALMTQIQTNEAFVTTAGNVDVYQPDWSVFMQLPNLVMGNLSASEAAATIFGYGIELIYLGFIVGYELLHDAVSRSGQVMARIFITLSWGIVIFNGWTDFKYGSFGNGFWGHVAFAVITSFIVGFFGTVGMYLVGAAWKRA